MASAPSQDLTGRTDPSNIGTIDLTNDNTSPFLSVPLEIRRKIYNLLLKEEHPIVIMTIYGQDSIGTARFVRNVERIDCCCRHESGFQNNAGKAKGNAYAEHERDLRSQQPSQLPPREDPFIMFACRQIYREAAEVLYGNNAFYFTSPTAFQRFIIAIGKCSQHLLYLKFDCHCERPGSQKSFELLARVEGIRELEIHPSSTCLFPDHCVVQIASDCQPLLRSLKKHYESQAISRSPLDVIRFTRCQPYCSYSKDCVDGCYHFRYVGHMKDRKYATWAAQNRAARDIFTKHAAEYLRLTS